MKNKKIKEAIDYGDYPERMGSNLERTAGNPDSLYGSNPAMSRGPQDVERLIGERFKKIVDHLKRVTNIQDLSSQQVQEMLFNEMMSGFSQIVRIENGNIPALKELALEACIDETEIDPSWYQFEISLNQNDIDTSKFRFSPEDEDEDEENNGEESGIQIPSFDVEDLTQEEKLELEKHKRNIINAIVQGAAKKAHHIYEKPEVKAKLDEINPGLYPLYRKVMSITDFMYFTMDEMIDRMSQTGSGVIGQNFLDEPDGEGGEDGDSPVDTKIVAKATMFPVLCHEIIKGIKEATARHSLPKEPGMAQKVMGQTDILSNEPIQLRIGPELYEKLRMLLPDDMFLDENKGLISWFEKILYDIPPKEFLKIISNVISQDESKNRLATQVFSEIMREAILLKREYDEYDDGESNDTYGPDDDDDGPDNLDDLLRGSNVRLPD
jgi:hypothetical protein